MKMPSSSSWPSALLLLAACGSAAAAEATAASSLRAQRSQPVQVPRLSVAPVIDGALDDESWQQAAVLSDFYQVAPGDNIAPSQPTEALLGYDADALYIAFVAHDDPEKIRATVAQRDAIFADDTVGLYLDTFNDQRRAYALFFNPLGVQGDALYTEGAADDYSVDVVMRSKGAIGAKGYTVEIAVPFKSLRYRIGKGAVWGLHLFRRIKRLDDERQSWMPLSREVSSFLSQAGRITGLEDVGGRRALEIIPSFTLTEAGRRVASGATADATRFRDDPVQSDPGLTARLTVASSVTADLTLNPDFAQVEADQPVVTVNQRFPIFYEEKRPFFLEGIDVFQTPLRTVHTRAIVDPDVATKVTGKHGRDTFGAVLASDNAPGNFSEDERADPAVRARIAPFLDKNAAQGILRWKRDVGQESSLGLMATSYDFEERHNHTLGLDGRMRLDPQTVITWQVAGTRSRARFFDPDTGERPYRDGDGLGYIARYQRTGRHFSLWLAGAGRTRDYRTDLGFNRRANTNRHELKPRYDSEPKPNAGLISWYVQLFNDVNYDFQGRMQSWDVEPGVGVTLRHQTEIKLAYSWGYERVLEEELGPKRSATRAGTFFGDPQRSTRNRILFLSATTAASKTYSASVDLVHTWNAFDLDFGAGPRFPRVSPAALVDPESALDPGAGNLLDLSLSLNWQPTDAWRTSVSYTRSRLRRRDSARLAFDDQIVSARTTYQITRFLFLRLRGDYDSLESRARGEFLFGWTPNPGTALYVGYNDTLTRAPGDPLLDLTEPGFRRQQRTFFMKLSYLFRRTL